MRNGTISKDRHEFEGLILYKIILVIVMTVFPTCLFAQITARGLGMGGAYTALARGAHAPAWNPANLGLPDNPHFSMTFVSVGVGVWNNAFTKSMYDQYFVNGEKDEDGNIIWDQDDIEDILNHIPDDGLRMHSDVSVRTFTFSTGQWAVSLGADAGSLLRMDKALLRLPLEGNTLNETYHLRDTRAIGLGVGMLGFSWGQPVTVSFADIFSVGGTVRILYGGVYGETERAEGSFITREYGFDVDADYELAYSFEGKVGFGLDVGAAAQFGERWTVSLGLANVLGTVPWSNSDKEVGYVRGDTLAVLDISEDDDEDDVLDDSTWTLEDLPGFSSRMPVVIRLGVAYREGPILLTADYTQGFKDGAFTSSTPMVAVGTEGRWVPWLPLRMGVVIGGRMGLGTSIGFGIRPGGFVMDFGVMTRGLIVPGNSKGYIFGLEFGMELNKPESGVLRVKDF